MVHSWQYSKILASILELVSVPEGIVYGEGQKEEEESDWKRERDEGMICHWIREAGVSCVLS